MRLLTLSGVVLPLWLAAATDLAEVPFREKASKHPAFQPTHRPAMPAVQNLPAGYTPIDRFLHAKLEAHGLSLSPRADRATLIRRLAFTLTGLPPTPEEIEAFVSDPDGVKGWERAVDRYLNSHHYGERWGKHWLDAAGYADSNGYFNADSDRPLAYRYRDYVIRAFNRDLPFDQFVREQLAGDELTEWTPGQPATPAIIELLTATHFLRNGQDGSGESDGNPDEVRADRYYALESSMQIIGSCLFGLTLQCCKCHDHKFEPLAQTDYYRFQAILYPAFNIEKWKKPNERVVYANLPGELERWQAQETVCDREAGHLKTNLTAWLREHRPPGETLFADDFAGNEPLSVRWSNTAPGDNHAGGNPPVRLDTNAAPAALKQNKTLAIIESGGSGDRWISTRSAFDWKPARTGDWIQVTFDLVALRVNEKGKLAERIGYFIGLHDFDDDGSVAGGNILIDGNPQGGAQVHLDYPGRDSVSRGKLGEAPYQAGGNYGVRVTNRGQNNYLLEHLVDGVAEGATLELKDDELVPGGFGFEYCCGRSFVVNNVRVEASPTVRTVEFEKREKEFREQYTKRRKAFDDAIKAINRRRAPKPGQIAWASDMATETPVVHLLNRGNPKTPGAVVEPATFAFLNGAGAEPRFGLGSSNQPHTGRRLELAKWLTEPGSPQAGLLARVVVNRMWQQYFGHGIVETTENLGLSGATATQPELLEWLAAELESGGWRFKRLHRWLAVSAAFQQSSAPREQALKVDPENTMLWRYPLRRLDAEAMRDAMLAVGGRLGQTVGGPYVPSKRNESGETIIDEALPGAMARSVYLQQKRTQVPTVLSVFDAPSVVFNCTRRFGTTMPLQSLSLLNSDFALRRAADLARRLEKESGGDPETRLMLAFRLVCARNPQANEREAASRFVETQSKLYAERALADPERRAWTDFCQMLFASNAFLYLE